MSNVVKFPDNKRGCYEDVADYASEVTQYLRALIVHFMTNQHKKPQEPEQAKALNEFFDAYEAFMGKQGYTGEFFNVIDRAFTEYLTRVMKLSDSSLTGLSRTSIAVYCIYDEVIDPQYPWPRWFLHTTFDGVGAYTYTDVSTKRSDVVYAEWIYSFNGTPKVPPSVHDDEQPGVLRCTAVQPWAYYKPVHINNAIAMLLSYTERDDAVLWHQSVTALDTDNADGLRMGWRCIKVSEGLIDFTIAKESFLVFPQERFLFAPYGHQGWQKLGEPMPVDPTQPRFPSEEESVRLNEGLELEIAKYAEVIVKH